MYLYEVIWKDRCVDKIADKRGFATAVFLIRKRRIAALPISAGDMTLAERRYYHEYKEGR